MIHKLFLILPCLFLLSFSPSGEINPHTDSKNSNRENYTSSSDNKQSDLVRHMVIYREEGVFAGWPANNGIWIWGDELLVGFVKAEHKDSDRGHTYEEETSRGYYARSVDGGETWSVEDPFERGQKAETYNNNIGSKAQPPAPLSEPINFNHPDLALTFLRQTNDTGPSFFYYSYDRGETWNGAYSLPNLGTQGIAARTDYIVNGENSLLSFVTAAKRNGKEGRVICIETVDGGITWKLKSHLGLREPDGFEIMPATIRLSATQILCVVRKRNKENIDLLVSYISGDNGSSWKLQDEALAYTGNGGSPAALIKLESGEICLAYIKRNNNGSKLIVRYSVDDGISWSDEIILREKDGANWDVGYPRMVQRPDGKLFVSYYWNNANMGGQNVYRYIAGTLFDKAIFYK